MSRRADAPSARVLVVGGIGVVAVVAFVVAVALGGRTVDRPGDRVGAAEGDGPTGLVVLADRCLQQRVAAVEVVDADDGTPRWRIESAKGSIERAYEVGERPPSGFETVTPLEGGLDGPVIVSVTFTRSGEAPTADQRVVDPARPPDALPDLGEAPARCGGEIDLGFTSLLFAAGAVVVVAGYLSLVRRRWRDR